MNQYRLATSMKKFYGFRAYSLALESAGISSVRISRSTLDYPWKFSLKYKWNMAESYVNRRVQEDAAELKLSALQESPQVLYLEIPRRLFGEFGEAPNLNFPPDEQQTKAILSDVYDHLKKSFPMKPLEEYQDGISTFGLVIAESADIQRSDGKIDLDMSSVNIRVAWRGQSTEPIKLPASSFLYTFSMLNVHNKDTMEDVQKGLRAIWPTQSDKIYLKSDFRRSPEDCGEFVHIRSEAKMEVEVDGASIPLEMEMWQPPKAKRSGALKYYVGFGLLIFCIIKGMSTLREETKEEREELIARWEKYDQSILRWAKKINAQKN